MRGPIIIVLAALLVPGAMLGTRVASAEEPPVVKLPTVPRVVEAPTAWLQPRNTIFATAGADWTPNADQILPFAAVIAGLGDVAELDVTVSGLSGDLTPTAQFKMGHRLGRLGGSVGLRKSFAGTRTAQAFVVASLDLGQVGLHGGAEAWAIGDEDPATDTTLAGIRPLGGLEWTPPTFPRTTVLADVVWAPRPEDAALGWIGSIGARFTPRPWISVELGFQLREDALLDRPTIFARANLWK